MNINETLIEIFGNPAEVTTLPNFIISMLLSAFLGLLLAQVYVRFGSSLSNRKTLAKTFLMLAITTTLIITIVKSSLALSLGLVGALSIVRFRAAIKEPEELTYLFLAIGIGLGMGANQPLITIAAFVIIVTIIILASYVQGSSSQPNMFVTVSGKDQSGITAKGILQSLSDVGAKASLKRTDVQPGTFEASFLVDFSNVDSLEKFTDDMKSKNPDVHVSCMDNQGLEA